ncbi:MAG: LssY C-terminal domain-containing protein [Planctomycetota bacterium]
MTLRIWLFLQRVFATGYAPQPLMRSFLARDSQTKATPLAEITVAVLSAKESRQVFGVPMARRSIQPVFLRITNRHDVPLRLFALDIDPQYYTPLEASSLNHFSVLKQLSAFGIAAFYFLPLLIFLPLKLFAASRANTRMDRCFDTLGFPLRPIPPGKTVEGFVYTTLDAGNKTVRACLYTTLGISKDDDCSFLSELSQTPCTPAVNITFLIPVVGLSTDYSRLIAPEGSPVSPIICCDHKQLVTHLVDMPAATTNASVSHVRHGDPVNLVIIGNFETLLSAFAARWDECESITFGTCWKTFRSFLLGQEYRYSPVSPLYLFGRGQDVALQRIRSSINERLHLRLWLTPLRFSDKEVWVGQVSRDIGIRFTLRAWNLTTHRVDPNVDESRDYVLEDLLRAKRVEAVGYVDGAGICLEDAPKYNLTGDPYYTDGQRVVVVLSSSRIEPQQVGCPTILSGSAQSNGHQ